MGINIHIEEDATPTFKQPETSVCTEPLYMDFSLKDTDACDNIVYTDRKDPYPLNKPLQMPQWTTLKIYSVTLYGYQSIFSNVEIQPQNKVPFIIPLQVLQKNFHAVLPAPFEIRPSAIFKVTSNAALILGCVMISEE